MYLVTSRRRREPNLNVLFVIITFFFFLFFFFDQEQRFQLHSTRFNRYLQYLHLVHSYRIRIATVSSCHCYLGVNIIGFKKSHVSNSVARVLLPSKMDDLSWTLKWSSYFEKSSTAMWIRSSEVRFWLNKKFFLRTGLVTRVGCLKFLRWW